MNKRPKIAVKGRYDFMNYVSERREMLAEELFGILHTTDRHLSGPL
jgi:hypothetical protein